MQTTIEAAAHFIAFRRTHWATGREEFILVTNDIYAYAEDAQAQLDEWADSGEYDELDMLVLKAMPFAAAA